MKVRFPPFDPDNLPADARAVYDRIMTERGYVPGPYQFWLASPGFADRIEPVEEFLRHGVSLEERLVEVAVLVVAKHWRAQYVWTSHGPAAEKAGVAPAIVEAIRAGEKPAFDRDDEAVCYRFCTDMIAGREADDTLWAEAQAVLKVDDAVFTERLYRFARCGVQGDEGIARRHCEDDSFAIIVVIAQSFSGALSRGIVEALTFLWAPHP